MRTKKLVKDWRVLSLRLEDAAWRTLQQLADEESLSVIAWVRRHVMQVVKQAQRSQK